MPLSTHKFRGPLTAEIAWGIAVLLRLRSSEVGAMRERHRLAGSSMIRRHSQ